MAIKYITPEEKDKRLAELKNKGKSTSKVSKEVKNEPKINIETNMKDIKYLYTLKCDYCSKDNPDYNPGKKELTEMELEKILAVPHKYCNQGKVIVIDRKPLQENEPNLENPPEIKHLNTPFYNAKIDFKFNPCKNNCFFNSDSSSYNVNLARGWKCPKTSEHLLACQNLVMYEEMKKISEKGISVNSTNTEIQPSDVDVKYDDGHSVKVNIKDIWRLFVIRSCFSKQNKSNPDIFGIMEIKDEYGEVLCDEQLTDKIIVESLKGEITIGIHQTNKKSRLKWLCYDIDKKHVTEGTPKDLAESIVKYLKEWYGLTGYIEKSGSIDNFHVWLLFEPTTTEIAYNFHKDFESRLKNVGVPVKGYEKVISIGGGKGYGVMIKLPFNIQRKNNGRSEFLGDLSKIQPEILPEIKS